MKERDVYRWIFERSREPSVLIDDSRRILARNHAALELESAIERLLSDEQPRGALGRIFDGLRAHGSASAELSVADPSGAPRVLEIDAKTLENGQHVLVLYDVSARRSLEQEISQLRRVDSLGFLTASVVHDFNNMLTPMLCLSEALVGELAPDARLSRFARELLSAAERATGLVRQLLAFARRDSENARRVDVSVAVTDLRPIIARAVGEQVQLVLSVEQGAGSASVDRDQLEQVVMNLAVNARDAMPGGGRLTIGVAKRTLSDVDARDSKCPRAGEHIVLSVSDTGVGIPREIQQRIFERLFSTKGSGASGGLGLGLATAQSFAVRSGGCIAVQSEPGRGATISIYLPRLPDSEPAPAPAALRAPRGSETVLVVDDDEGVRDVVRFVLEGQGYRVFCSASATEARATFERSDLTVDLLITDVVLSDASGKRLAEVARTNGHTKVLFITGHTDEVVRDNGVVASDAVLRKAFSPSELARRVREVLDA